MADIKWIKLDVNVFNNRKVEQLEVMPDGDGLVVVWLKLLCLAGSVNDDGMVYFTPELPYTEEMLATQFHRPLPLIKLALRVFEQFGMITIIDSIIHISNWEKYQNVDRLQKIREQGRNRVARHREKQKRIPGKADCNVTCNATVTQCNATDIDRDIDRDRDTKRECTGACAPAPSAKKPARHKYGAYANVLLTDDEYAKLKAEFPSDLEERIQRLSEYIESKGAKYKSHLATIRAWARRDRDGQPGDRLRGTDRADQPASRFSHLSDPI
jgi:predicted phage replisome organizer